ncbi:hypothetical protein KEM48_002235 [Puccinia striiformis f. sp. tritici PST-130]|nr:hypothetical protein KEM48_002235 [Puccinia striiformis f. sp. tritici PST-130]
MTSLIQVANRFRRFQHVAEAANDAVNPTRSLPAKAEAEDSRWISRPNFVRTARSRTDSRLSRSNRRGTYLEKSRPS